MPSAPRARRDDRVDVALTLGEASSALGIPESTLSGWATHGRRPSGDERAYLRDLLGAASLRGRATRLDAFEPYQAHVCMVLQGARVGDFGPMRHLAMGWLQRTHGDRVRDLLTMVGGAPDVSFTAFFRHGVQGLIDQIEVAVRQGRTTADARAAFDEAVSSSLTRLERGVCARPGRRRPRAARSLEAVA